MTILSNKVGGWNRQSTTAIKGLCAIFVMFSHVFQQVSWAGFWRLVFSLLFQDMAYCIHGKLKLTT